MRLEGAAAATARRLANALEGQLETADVIARILTNCLHLERNKK